MPDFCIPGWQKCGTTSLMRYLESHPQVMPAFRKEVNFFNRHYPLGRLWYRAFFPTRPARALRRLTGGGRAVTGESTPNYLGTPGAIERMASALPNLRVVVLIRDPVERAYSHYQMHVRLGRDDRSWEEALRDELAGLAGRDREEAAEGRHGCPYLSRGLYRYQLEKLRRAFGPESMKVVLAEDLFDDPQTTFSGITEFLGISPHRLTEVRAYNRGTYEDMPEELTAELEEFFRPETARLAEVLGLPGLWSIL
jgi:hypothetical protein